MGYAVRIRHTNNKTERARTESLPSFRGGVYGKTNVNISLETILGGSLTLLMLGENQKLKNTSTCKNLYRQYP